MSVVLNAQDIKNYLVKDSEKGGKSFGKNTVKGFINVINGYGRRDGVIDTIFGIVYRIWNAVKSIFGQSDWLLAKNAMKRMLVFSSEEEFYKSSEHKMIPPYTMKKALATMRSAAEEFSEGTLQTLVDLTYENKLVTTNELEALSAQRWIPIAKKFGDKLRASIAEIVQITQKQ